MLEVAEAEEGRLVACLCRLLLLAGGTGLDGCVTFFLYELVGNRYRGITLGIDPSRLSVISM